MTTKTQIKLMELCFDETGDWHDTVTSYSHGIQSTVVSVHDNYLYSLRQSLS